MRIGLCLLSSSPNVNIRVSMDRWNVHVIVRTGAISAGRLSGPDALCFNLFKVFELLMPIGGINGKSKSSLGNSFLY